MTTPSENLRFVQVRSFWTPWEANLLAAQLEANGIRTFIGNERVVTAMWQIASLVGGVNVFVLESEVDAAKVILTQLDSAVAVAQLDGNKPRADPDVVKVYSWRWAAISMLLFGFPIPRRVENVNQSQLLCRFRWWHAVLLLPVLMICGPGTSSVGEFFHHADDLRTVTLSKLWDWLNNRA